MKTVAIIHKDQPAIGTFPADYAPRYASLSAQGAKLGLRFCEASAYDWDVAAGKFSRVRMDEKAVENFRPDLVWHKNSGTSAFVLAIDAAYGPASVNRAQLIALVGDKYATYRRFPAIMSRTVLLSEAASDPSLVAGWAGDKVVVKPRTGFGGKGVTAVAKADLAARAGEFPGAASGYVVQEWMDSSGGVPGLVEGVHDVRAVIVGGEISHFCVRAPKSGDFRCNVSAGGTSWDFRPGEKPVPQAFLDAYQAVIDGLGDGFYSADCCLDKSGRVLLGEVNNAPGVDVDGPEGLQDEFHARACAYFLSRIG